MPSCSASDRNEPRSCKQARCTRQSPLKCNWRKSCSAWRSLPPCSKLSMMKRTFGFMSPLNESQAQEDQLASPKEVHAAADYDRGLREGLRLCLDKTSLLLSCRATDSPGPGVAKRLSAGDVS